MALYTKVLEGKWIDDVMKNGEIIINKVYGNYSSIYTLIINFIKENKLQLSNINILLNEDIQYNEMLQIYVIDPKDIAKKLFSLLCKKFDGDFVLNTELVDKQYSINHIAKTYVQICYIECHNSVCILDLFVPLIINEIQLVPPILELIDLYKQIYNPEYANEWISIIHKANKVKRITDKNIIDTTTYLKTGGECINCIEPIVTEIIKQFKEFFKKYKDYVLVDMPKTDERFTIISGNTIQTDFERINTYFSTTVNSDFVIVFINKELFLGKDMRMQKHTFYISASHTNKFAEKKIGILDIYNNMEYEVVPYIEDNGIKIAHSWISIRFYYIQIWNIFVAHHTKLITYDEMNIRINRIKSYIEKSIDWTDPPLLYIGSHINESQAFKQIMIKETKVQKLYCGDI